MARKSNPKSPTRRKLTAQEIDVGIKKLNRRVATLEQFLSEGVRYDSSEVEAFELALAADVLEIFGPDSLQYKDFAHFRIYESRTIGVFLSSRPTPVRNDQPPFLAALPKAIILVKGLIQTLTEDREDLIETDVAPSASDSSALPAVELVQRVLDGFHSAVVAMQRPRYAGRATLQVADEYDVQDVLRYLLSPLFDDVRAEEPTPSSAGGSARMDFVVKTHDVAIELKMASPHLTDKKLGEQLAIDIQRYAAHPNCKALYFLVYDPHHSMKNPRGFERDLHRDAPFPVRVFVRPRR